MTAWNNGCWRGDIVTLSICFSLAASLAVFGIAPGDHNNSARQRLKEIVDNIKVEENYQARIVYASQLGDIVCQMDPALLRGEDIDEIASLLGDRSQLVRDLAARALGDIGPKAGKAISALEALTRDIERSRGGSPWNGAHTGIDPDDQVYDALQRVKGHDPSSPCRGEWNRP